MIPGEKPVSIGPFPAVTSNFRKTDVFQLQRKPDGATTRFYNAEKDQYVACNADGTIRYVNTDDEEDESTQWIMDKQSYQKGENVFQSKLTHLYLSYAEGTPVKKQEDKKGEMLTSDRCNKKDPLLETKELISNLFTTATTTTKAAVTTISSKAGVVAPEAVSYELVGSKTINKRSIWRLDPCMPRAVSSQKIKTFAIGTSIAVGTTVAMPFALAGVGALLGAVGAEVGIVANVIFAGLTGVEALASVGAIGATAYIVFRPEENSLTDDHDEDDDKKEEKAWSKRPFSNWRNW
uniref:Ricin B lectin domain-containing protein n=1 Tax=Proboscia inermis TaxID=420281 RepID=A0A7S0CBA0_9STRA